MAEAITAMTVEHLATAGLFSFDVQAAEELDHYFLESAPVQHEASDELMEQGRALAHLHAAEFALAPAFADPEGWALPPSTVVRVEAVHARLALLKGDCSLILWTHAPDGGRIRSLSASDLTVFSGDTSKLNRLRPEWAIEATNAEYLDDAVALLEEIYRRSEWPVAQMVAQIGVVRLQGLLWRLKTAVVYGDPAYAIPEAVRDYLDFTSQHQAEPAPLE